MKSMKSIFNRMAVICTLCLTAAVFTACSKDDIEGNEDNESNENNGGQNASLSDIYYLDEIPYNLIGESSNKEQITDMMVKNGCEMILDTIYYANADTIVKTTMLINDKKQYTIIAEYANLYSKDSFVLGHIAYFSNKENNLTEEQIDSFLEKRFGIKLESIPETDEHSEIFRKRGMISDTVELFVHKSGLLQFVLPGTI